MLFGEQAVVTLLAVPLGFALGLGLSALLAFRFESDLFRIPLVIRGTTWLFAFLVVALAALLSGLVVRRRLDRLDLVEVLKTRE
jgi:putative ABC transport system permease protein